MSSIVGSFDGTILAATFGVMAPEKDSTAPPFAYGDLAGLGWSCRFSIPAHLLGQAVTDTLQAGGNVPVLMHGTAIAEQKRNAVIVKVKATGITVPTASINGEAKTAAAVKS